MVDVDSPDLCAIDARDQCVALAGFCSSVATITSSTLSNKIEGGRPGRGSSTSPSNRSDANRPRHLRTVGTLTPSRCASRTLLSPAAAPNTIRQRNASACALLRRRVQRTSCSRSASLSVISTAFGPRELIHEDYHKPPTN